MHLWAWQKLSKPSVHISPNIFFTASWHSPRKTNKQANTFTFSILKNFLEILLALLTGISQIPLDIILHSNIYFYIYIYSCHFVIINRNLQKVISCYITTWRSPHGLQYYFTWPLVKDLTVVRNSLCKSFGWSLTKLL